MRLEHHFGLTRAGTVLDVGCGVGRLAIGLLVRLGELAAYRGFDVDRSDVEWCSRHIGRHHPGFAFFHVDMANARYNPEGEPVRADTRLPFADESFDAVYANSVFTHMEAGDVRVYLHEIGRMLRHDGGAFVTAFVEPDVPEVAVNPPDYMDRWSGPLHCVRYESGYFEYMIEDAGLRIDRFDHRAFTVGQSAFYLSKRT